MVCRSEVMLKSFIVSFLEGVLEHPATGEMAHIVAIELKTLVARKLPPGGTASTIWRGSSSTNALYAVWLRRSNGGSPS